MSKDVTCTRRSLVRHWRAGGICALGIGLIFGSMAATAPAAEAASVSYFLPFPAGKAYTVTQGPRGGDSHNTTWTRDAWDFGLALGQDVAASAPGRVITALGNIVSRAGWGNVVVVRHEDGTCTRYAHLSSVAVQAGATVTQAQIVGRSGSTGRSTGPHLHFQREACATEASVPVGFVEGDPWARPVSQNRPTSSPLPNPSPPPTNCQTGADRVVLYSDQEFRGSCTSYSMGDYRDLGSMAAQASSIRVGGNVIAEFWDTAGFAGAKYDRGGDDNSLHNDGWGDRIRSLKVSNRASQPQPQPQPATCAPTADQVALYAGVNYGGSCHVFGSGTVALPAQLGGVGNDQAESIKVGGNVKVTVCRDPELTGPCSTFASDVADLRGSNVSDNAVSSLKVESRAAPTPPPTPTTTPAPTTTTRPGCSTTAPTFVYPGNGQSIGFGGYWMFKVNPVPGSTGYLWGFKQDGQLRWENYANEGKLNGVDYTIAPGSQAQIAFHRGTMEVMVRALVCSSWTEAAVITITLT